MALLSIAERESLVSIIRALQVGSAGKFLDARSVERLTTIFRDKCGNICCGNESGVSFINGMRDEPWVTILNTLLCANDAAGTIELPA